MNSAAFLAGMLLGYKLGRSGEEFDMNVTILGKEIVRVTIGGQVFTVPPEEVSVKLTQILESNEPAEPYYSGWRSELDQYYHERYLTGERD